MRIRTIRLSGAGRTARRAAFAVAAGALLCASATVPAAVPATLPVASAAPAASAAPVDGDGGDGESGPRFLSLSIDSVTPSVVDERASQVTVSGSVRNVGDRTVSGVDVRLQRAPAVTREEGLRTVLGLDQAAYGTTGLFHRVADALDRGESAPFTLTLPLDDPAGPSLGITRAGVYPLLVNVNGTPDYGGTARLDDARFLLPVLSVPRHPGVSENDENSTPPDVGTSSPPAAPSAPPTPITFLYPLAADPAEAAGYASSARQAPGARLTGPALPTSIEPGGRLDGVLAAAADALDPGDDEAEPMSRGLCLAVDPDLLTTVDAMTRGVRISDDPADPDASTGDPDPAAQAAAVDWLARLRALAARTCTVSLPYAQADLDAVAGLDAQAITDEALRAPADIVDRILGVASVRGLVWPSTGEISSAAAASVPEALGDVADPVVMLADEAVDTAAMQRAETTESAKAAENKSSGRARLAAGPGGTVGALLFDGPIAAAMAGAGARPSTPAFVPDRLRYGLDTDSRRARLQDALGALAWPALHRDTGSAPGGDADTAASGNAAGTGAAAASDGTHSTAGAGHADGPSPVIVAPPQDWTIDSDEAAALLSLLDRLYTDGLAAPRPLTAAMATAGAPDIPTAEPVDPSADGVPGELVDRLADELPRLRTLRGMLAGPAPDGETPEQYMAPLYRDVLRAVSTAGSESANPTAADAAGDAADRRTRALQSSLTGQFAAVTVLSPGSVYTLASSQSPVLIVAQNDLRMPVSTGLRIQAPAGVRVGPADDYVVPGLGSRQIQVPAEIEYSRQIDLRVQLTAPDGTLLGEQIHIALHSNAYGMVIPVLTGVSGALLLFLAGRRTWHRLRGQHDRADDRAGSRGPILEQYGPQDRRDPEDEG